MKKASAISILVCTVALAGLCGCGSNSGQSSSQPTQATTTAPPASQPPPKPKKPKGPIENRLAVGMTMDEVREACGNPRDTATNSDGSAVWTFASGSPTYNPWGGWGAKFHYVTVVFDAAGKVKS